MLVFVGQYQHSLDDKGRLVLPVKYRREFENGGHLSPNADGCLSLWTPGEFMRRSAEYLELSRQGDPIRRDEARFWASRSIEVEIDRQGRFALPATSRSFGRLESEVFIVGNLDHVELWNPDVYAARQDPAEESFKRGGF